MQHFIKFSDNSLLDLSQVVYVGPVGGDPSCLRYSVITQSGQLFEIYEEERYNRKGISMARDEFVKQLMEFCESAKGSSAASFPPIQ